MTGYLQVSRLLSCLCGQEVSTRTFHWSHGPTVKLGAKPAPWGDRIPAAEPQSSRPFRLSADAHHWGYFLFLSDSPDSLSSGSYTPALLSVFKRCFQSQSNCLLQICWVSLSLVFILSLDEGFQDSAFVQEICEGKNVECFVCRFVVNKLLFVESST